MRKLTSIFFQFSLFILLSQAVQGQSGQALAVHPNQADAAQKDQSTTDVSISIDPGKIIQILQREPGLTFVVKKLLADAALEEGRLLDDTSFPDSTLYYLIQSDDNIRAMVTAELIKRKYIQVAMTDQEVTSEYLKQHQMQTELSRSAKDQQNEPIVYSASDPERKIKSLCEPGKDEPSRDCIPRETRASRSKTVPNELTSSPTPIQPT